MNRTMSNPILRALTVTAAAFGVVFGAQAAPHNAEHGGWQHGFMKQLSQLHNQLQLSPEQEKQWQNAVDVMKQNRQTERASRKQMREQWQAMLQQPILDLNALHAAQQQAQQQRQQLHEQTMQAWLSVYNGLNDQQKIIVSTALKQRFAKMQAWREKMHERWEQSHQNMPAKSGKSSDMKP